MEENIQVGRSLGLQGEKNLSLGYKDINEYSYMRTMKNK